MKRSALCAVVVLAFASACNDGSGSSIGDLTAPSVVLTFPPAVSSTDAESITVTGTASDPSGVAEVRVNGVLASSSDDFATWQASLPLALGMNTLTVAASDLRGNSDTRAAQARIESQALLLTPMGIAVDPSRQVAFVLDGTGNLALRAVDLASGLRSTVSDSSHGTGPIIFSSSGIALDGDRALVVEPYPGSVIAVDLVSGDREILSGASHGTGPSLAYLKAIAVAGDRALVTSSSFGEIVAVDLGSGDRTILSSPSVGSGPDLLGPVGIVADGGRALVVNGRGWTPGLLAVDLTTGDRTILSDASTGTGPMFSELPSGVTLAGSRVLVSDPGNYWRGVTQAGAVFAVDLLSGNRMILSAPYDATSPAAVAMDGTDGTRVLVADPSSEAIVAVDLASGERTVVSPRTSVGAGPSFQPGAIALEESRALVAGRDGTSLVAVDYATGERTIVSDASTGSGPEFVDVGSIVVDGGRALVLAKHAVDQGMQGNWAIFAVDLASGDRSIVSDSSTGEGPALSTRGDIALAGSSVLVAQWRTVLAVDLASGDRTIVADDRRGTGRHFWSLGGIVADGNRAFVIDNDDCSSWVLEVDLATGDRRVISDDISAGEGPGWKDLTDLVLDGERLLVGRSPGGTIYAVDLATGDRAILSDWTTGAGPGFDPEEIAKDGDRVWVTAPYFGAIMAVDTRFGQRTIVAR